MNKCVNLYYLSTLACKLSECLSEDELAILIADLAALSGMLTSIVAQEAICKEEK